MALIVVSLLVLSPGVPAAFLLYGPGRLPPPTRLAAAVALGYAISGGAAFALAIGGVLRPETLLILLVPLTGALWFLAARRGSARLHAAALRREALEDRWPLLLGVVALLAIAAYRTTYLGAFPVISPFRYWVDGMEIADSGGVPGQTLHFGDVFPTATSKIFLNAFSAAVDLLVGGDAPGALNALLLVSAVGSAVGLWALGWELGIRYAAPLLPVLAVANRLVLNRELTVDLFTYKAEVLGRMVAFCAVPLAVRVLREGRGWRHAAVAGAALAAAATSHLVPLIVMVALLGWYALGTVLAGRRLLEVAVQGGITAAALGVVAGVVLLLPAGMIGFEGAARPQTYALPEAEFDQSLYLFTGRIEPPATPEGAFFQPPGGLAGRFVSSALGLRPPSLRAAAVEVGLVLGVLGLALAVWMVLRFPHGLRPNGVAAWGLAATLLGGTLFFSLLYEVWVPATFGPRRLYDYSSLPVLVAGLTVLEAGLLYLGRRRPWAAPAAAAVLVLAATAVVVPTSRAPRSLRDTREVVDLVSWIRTNTSCNDRLLVDERMVGLIRAMTGRVAVVEGMGPFLRPDMLDLTVDLMMGARRFFAEPEANRDFLARHAVDYVVVTPGVRVGYPEPIGRVDPDRLRAVPFLELVHRTPGVEVYRVTGDQAPRSFPSPGDYPGYRCRSDPLPAAS